MLIKTKIDERRKGICDTKSGKHVIIILVCVTVQMVLVSYFFNMATLKKIHCLWCIVKRRHDFANRKWSKNYEKGSKGKLVFALCLVQSASGYFRCTLGFSLSVSVKKIDGIVCAVEQTICVKCWLRMTSVNKRKTLV